jgi:anti-sigma-K factor RskA
MTPEPDDRALAGEYALGLLEGEAKASAERRLASDAAFACEVRDWQMRFSAFDDSADPRPAGEELWSRIAAGVAAPAPVMPAAPSWWTRLWGDVAALRATALGASLAALLLAVGLGVAIRAAQQQPTMVAVLLDGDKPGAVVQAFADGRVVLVPLTAVQLLWKQIGQLVTALVRPGAGGPLQVSQQIVGNLSEQVGNMQGEGGRLWPIRRASCYTCCSSPS